MQLDCLNRRQNNQLTITRKTFILSASVSKYKSKYKNRYDIVVKEHNFKSKKQLQDYHYNTRHHEKPKQLYIWLEVNNFHIKYIHKFYKVDNFILLILLFKWKSSYKSDRSYDDVSTFKF